MKHEAREFEVQLLDWKEVHERPASWSPERLQRLLEQLELDGVAAAEAREMAAVALQDLEPDDASDAVLRVVFGDNMRAGIRQNLIPELREDRPWEEFADLTHQAGIFDAVVILEEAFPQAFGKPDAVAVRVRIASGSPTATGWLDASPPMSALLLRILAAGMDDRAVLQRLFAQALAADRFPEASSILWTVERSEGPDSSRDFALIASHQWLDPLEDVERFRASARPDT